MEQNCFGPPVARDPLRFEARPSIRGAEGPVRSLLVRRSTMTVTSSRSPALLLAPQSTPPLIPWTESVVKRSQRSRPPWASIANFARAGVATSAASYVLFICFCLASVFHLAKRQARDFTLFLGPSIREYMVRSARASRRSLRNAGKNAL